MSSSQAAGSDQRRIVNKLARRPYPSRSTPSPCVGRPWRVGITSICIAVFLGALAACSASVVDSSPQGIWLQKPLFGLGGGIESQAREHCARYDRDAVLSGDLDPGVGGNFRGILAYDCIDRRG